jgi:hypothetical protein
MGSALGWEGLHEVLLFTVVLASRTITRFANMIKGGGEKTVTRFANMLKGGGDKTENPLQVS